MPSSTHDELVEIARSARENAYAPYSDFNTGAAVLTEDGSVHIGTMVENLVFGVAMCAERVALFSSVAAGGSKPLVLAVAAPDTAGVTTFLCGPCLQVAIELGGPELTILSALAEGGYEARTIDELAPGIPRRGSPAN